MGTFSSGLPVKKNPNPPIMRTYSFSGNSCESNVKASTFSLLFILLSAFALVLAICVHNFAPELSCTREDSLSARKCLLRRFDARRVYNNLVTLSAFGPKVVGTYEYEILAVNFLVEKIKEAQNGAEGFANRIEYDIQTATDCYRGDRTCKCYDRIRNIVVRIKPKNVENTESLLVNAHFDTMPTSPGTSDDSLPCTIMLEFLRVLAAKEEPLNKNIIFLFNGAEEDGLLGSHAFITKHQWAENITCVVNLDACGAGGREILFQTGPKALILPDIYADSVPYPHGTVVGEELFQSGVLPSDTDFRNFRDYGHLKGLDFAHYRNGYVYHTSSDNISFVSTSTIQHTGSNILTLLHSLADRSDLKAQLEEREEQAVFFDIFGKFMVCYSVATAFKVNIAVIILSVAVTAIINIKIFKKRKVKSLSYHYVVNFVFFGLGLFLVAVVTYGLIGILKFYGLIMLWYAQPWFAFAYYGIPALFTLTAVKKFRRRLFYSTITLEEEFLIFVAISQMVFTLLLLAATFLNIRTGYILTVELVPVCISSLLNCTIFRNGKVGLRIFVHLICNLVSFVYVMYLAVSLFELLIPILGRTGAIANTELILCVACVVMIVLLFSFFIPLVLLVENFWKIQLTVALAYVGFVAVVLFGSVLQPFSDRAPERFEVLHVNRKLAHPGDALKSESSGFFLVIVDPRAPQTVNALFGEQNFQPVADFCAEELYCGVPLTKQSLAKNNFEHSYWFPATKPKFPGTIKSINFTSSDESPGTKTFFFNVSGPPLSRFVVQPLNGSTLLEWSLEPTKPPQTSMSWLDEKVFLIDYVRGPEEMGGTPWMFWVKFDITATAPESYIFKLAWSAHYRTNNTDHYESSFRDVIGKFPQWTRVSSWVTDLEEYLF